jgi:hypothetical protein
MPIELIINLLDASMKILEWYLIMDLGRFISHSSKFIIHSHLPNRSRIICADEKRL